MTERATEAEPIDVVGGAAHDVVEESPTPEGDPVSLRAAADASHTRRAPRFGSFIFSAILLAALIAGGLTFVRDSVLPEFALQGRALSGGGMFLVLFIGLAPFLTLAAVAFAVWLDRRSVRRMERAAASR